MIETATFYRVKCDRCGVLCPSSCTPFGEDDHEWWKSVEIAEEVAIGEGYRWNGERIVCPDCHLEEWGECDE